MEEQLFFLINSNHTPFFDTLMFSISQKTVWIPLYLSLLYVVWKNYSWKGAAYVLLMVGVGLFFTDFLNTLMLRELIARPRPSDPQSPIAPYVHIVFGRRGSGFGMPSAHSANMWMLTGIMVYWIRDRWMALTLSLLTLLVCYSRVYLGMHYPGDILGGFLLAAVVAGALCYWHYRRHSNVSPKLSSREREAYRQWRVTHPVQTWVPALMTILTLLSFCISASMM